MAFKTREEIEAGRPEQLAREAAAARADHDRRSAETRNLVVITLDEDPRESFPSVGKVVKFVGREAGSTRPLSAIYFVPDHEKLGRFGEEDLDARVGALGAGDRMSLAGKWGKRRWKDGEGREREAWEFRVSRFEKGDATLDEMERSARARIDVGSKLNGESVESSVEAAPNPSVDDAKARQRAAMSVADGPRRWSEDELVAMVPSLLRSSGGYDPYAGIGSRETTQDVCDDMTAVARVLEARGFTLRSGFAGGADTAFELGTTKDEQREIFAPWKGFGSNPESKHEKKRWDQIRRHEEMTGERFEPAKARLLEGAMFHKAQQLAAPHHPNWNDLQDGHRKLHSRNMGQVLGPNLDVPARFEMAWTIDGKATGGTGQAIRVAEASGIPVLNMHNPRIRAAVLAELGLEPQRDLAKDLEAAVLAGLARGAETAPARQATPARSAEPSAARIGGFDLKAPASRFIPEAEAVAFCKVKDPNGILSNMHNGSKYVDGGVTWNSEAQYQAARFPHLPSVQKEIWEQPTAYAAKTKAYEYIDQTRPDWQEVKDHMMAYVTTRKLANDEYRGVIDGSRGKQIVEISSRDQYWGAAKVDGGYRGQNQLGHIQTQLADGARMDELPPRTTFPSRAFMEGREEAREAGRQTAPRSVSYERGSIVENKADVLVNTVNCQLSERGNGVMGKGVALAFKEAFPSIMKDYEAAIRSGEMKPGRALLFDLPDGRKWAALGTKDSWRDNSQEAWVESGLKELGEKVRAAGLKSIAIPPPGCGNGGLDWKRVEPMVHKHLGGLDLAIYAKPSGAVVANDRSSDMGGKEEAGVSRSFADRMPEPSIRASMYFSFDGKKRPEVKSESTFEAITSGERTSTTRFREHGGFDRWKTLSPGNSARFYADREMRGEKVDVVVLGTREIDLSKMSAQELTAWSKSEGWSEQAGRDFGRRHGPAVQILYDLPENVDDARLAQARQAQREYEASRPDRQEERPVAMSSEPSRAATEADLRRARQRAAMGSGLG